MQYLILLLRNFVWSYLKQYNTSIFYFYTHLLNTIAWLHNLARYPLYWKMSIKALNAGWIPMPRPRRLHNYICYIPSCDRKTKLSLCLRVRPLESGINITQLRNIGHLRQCCSSCWRTNEFERYESDITSFFPSRWRCLNVGCANE